MAVPSQFSAIGFDVSSGEDLAALATHVAERADTFDAPDGQYLRWAPPSGEQLWLQLTRNGDAMGMTPHFAGRSRLRVGLEARVSRQSHTPLDTTFLGWANPPAGATTGGDYPFAFDCPNGALHAELALPVVVDVQMAAFAQQVTVYASEAEYRAAQAAQGLPFAPRSFIPSGLISPQGEPVDPPESHALMSGYVLETAEPRNSVTGQPFCWALVDAVGGSFDVVIDLELLAGPVAVGNIVAGWFWLTGQLQQDPPRTARGGWFSRLRGR